MQCRVLTVRDELVCALFMLEHLKTQNLCDIVYSCNSSVHAGRLSRKTATVSALICVVDCECSLKKTYSNRLFPALCMGLQPYQIEICGDVARSTSYSHQFSPSYLHPPFLNPNPSLPIFLQLSLFLYSFSLSLAPVYRAITEMISTVSQRLTDEAEPL